MDVTTLKQAITTSDYNYSSLGVFFREIKAILSVAFDNVIVNVCPRSCNIVAHELVVGGVNQGMAATVFDFTIFLSL